MADNTTPELEGFDPLSEGIFQEADRDIFENATRQVVQNILKSYTGYFDVFSELIQNSLDALDRRQDGAGVDFQSKLWIDIDIPSRRIRVADNGCGMPQSEVRFCFRPSVSFKTRKESRGHKGVGATFLAYGFNQIRLFTKTADWQISVRLAGGRQWADDASGAFRRPKLEIDDFVVTELSSEESGTAVEIMINEGQRPTLDWWNATNAEQWYHLLRMRTPLGGVYLSGKAAPRVSCHLRVTDNAGDTTRYETQRVEYFYPHEMDTVLPRVKSMSEIRSGLEGIEGDNQRIPQDLRKIDAMWDVWTSEQILAEDSPFAGQKFGEDEIQLIRRHDVSVYGCFLSSSKQWGVYQREVLRIRKEPLVLKGGLVTASDYMVQGDLSVIPLTSTIGYQANTHVIVHFHDGNPDMGRKVFQPEIKSLAESLARQAVNIFKRYLYLMREDTGAGLMTDDTELFEWLNEKREYQHVNPLDFSFHDKHIAYTCAPRNEQDVVALFHELVGIGTVQGIRFLCTSEQDRYDSAYFSIYDSLKAHGFSKSNPLGINQKLITNKPSKPFVLEYKYDFDSLISDFEKEIKFPNHINAVVCWSIGDAYREKYSLSSYMIGEEGSSRQFYGATHALWHERTRIADVFCVRDFMRFFSDPDGLIAEHKTRYGK
jgi:hypothetical protein